MSTWGGEVTGPGSLGRPRAAVRSDPGPVLFSMLCFLLVPYRYCLQVSSLSLSTLVMPLPELCFLQFVLAGAWLNSVQNVSRVLSGSYRRALVLHWGWI